MEPVVAKATTDSDVYLWYGMPLDHSQHLCSAPVVSGWRVDPQWSSNNNILLISGVGRPITLSPEARSIDDTGFCAIA